jgi:hypothetical protein
MNTYIPDNLSGTSIIYLFLARITPAGSCLCPCMYTPAAATFLSFQSCEPTCTQSMLIHGWYLIHFLCCTVHTGMCYRVGLHLQLHDHGQLLLPGQLGTATWLHRLRTFSWGWLLTLLYGAGVNSLGGLLLTIS